MDLQPDEVCRRCKGSIAKREGPHRFRWVYCPECVAYLQKAIMTWHNAGRPYPGKVLAKALGLKNSTFYMWLHRMRITRTYAPRDRNFGEEDY